jgi:nuclear distribution protein NudE
MTNDDEDSIEYWKSKYDLLSAEFDEYKQMSQEIENELDSQLKQNDDKIHDLEEKYSRCTHENDTLKRKLNELTTQSHTQISQLQQELSKIKSVKDEMQKYIRELEQRNDDLERTSRCAMFSLNEFETKLNEALEHNAILESELDEKEQLVIDVQRLRDESRDLKQELAARQKKDQLKHTNLIASTLSTVPTQPIPTTSATTTTTNANCNSNQQLPIQQDECVNTKSTIEQPQSTSILQLKDSNTQNPTKEFKRISCLNYVNDLLRKITVSDSLSSKFCIHFV